MRIAWSYIYYDILIEDRNQEIHGGSYSDHYISLANLRGCSTLFYKRYYTIFVLYVYSFIIKAS